MLIDDTAAGGIGDLFARGINHSHIKTDDNVFQAAASALSITSICRCFRICCYGFQPFVCCFFITTWLGEGVTAYQKVQVMRVVLIIQDTFFDIVHFPGGTRGKHLFKTGIILENTS